MLEPSEHFEAFLEAIGPSPIIPEPIIERLALNSLAAPKAKP